MFPIDFMVMDIEEENDIPLILGHPFMKTEWMMIDVDDGIIKVWVQDEEVIFNLFEEMHNSKGNGVCFNQDAVDETLTKCKSIQQNKHSRSSIQMKQQGLRNAWMNKCIKRSSYSYR